jgi:hypothetical protein
VGSVFLLQEEREFERARTREEVVSLVQEVSVLRESQRQAKDKVEILSFSKKLGL